MPEHLILVALDFVGAAPSDARRALADLAALVRSEVRAELDDPATEVGQLGYTSGYDTGHLTITLGISADGFDRLGVTGTDRPGDLRRIPWDDLGDVPRTRDSGHLVLQICSDDIFVCEHVLRRVENELDGALAVVWGQVGVQRFDSTQRVTPANNRALIGFLDGTGNLHPRTDEGDRKLVLVDPDAVGTYPENPPPDGGGDAGGPRYPANLAPVPTFEPEWTRNGSYMAVRVSLFDTSAWDALTKHHQEQVIGHFKVSGVSLDLTDTPGTDSPQPAYATDQSNLTVSLTAHVRKAGPRRHPSDAYRRDYRHRYAIICAECDRVRRGMAFMSFGRTNSGQFEFVLRAQMRNPDFPHPGAGTDDLLSGVLGEEVLCGGYYFVPAIDDINAPWTWRLPV